MINFSDRILYQNPACIVINKLKGEAAQGGKEGIVNLPKELRSFLNSDFVQAVHRVDVPVTGCVLFALTKNSLAFLNDSFARETTLQKARETTLQDARGTTLQKAGEGAISVEKRYWAIVEKTPELPVENGEQLSKGELLHWIETNVGKNKSFAYNEKGKGRKRAALRYTVTGEGKNYLFLEIELLSGRHHQIRAQLAAIGLHIKGDIKYGAKRNEKDGGIRLHARCLSFPNPLNTAEKITVTADPPVMDNLWTDFIKGI